MRLIVTPFAALSGIVSGNSHKDPLTVSGGESLLEVAIDFPNHSVFVKAPGFSRFVTSEILDGMIHIYYDETGRCHGVEIHRPGPANGLSCIGADLLDGTMGSVAAKLTARGIPWRVYDAGIEAPELGISLYAEDFTNNLGCRVDSVYAELRQS